MTTTCPKCQGTGFLRHLAHVDGGKCWSCTDKVDTSYTRNIEARFAGMTTKQRNEALAAEAVKLASVARRQLRAKKAE